MAKNEIKHRISLEGDEDVKRRLKAVGEAGKASMQDIEKRLGAARSLPTRAHRWASFAIRRRRSAMHCRRQSANSGARAVACSAALAACSPASRPG